MDNRRNPSLNKEKKLKQTINKKQAQQELNLQPGSLENIFRSIPDDQVLRLFKKEEYTDTKFAFRDFVKRLASLDEAPFSADIFNLALSCKKELESLDSNPSEKINVIKRLIDNVESNFDLNIDLK